MGAPVATAPLPVTAVIAAAADAALPVAARIGALLAWLAGDPAAAGQLTGLTGLVHKLRACDRPGPPRGAELGALWAEAIRVLSGFAAGASPDARPEFWKRSR